MVTDGKANELNEDWSVLLKSQTVAIIGVPRSIRLKVFDLLGNSVYTSRYGTDQKCQQNQWFPHVLRNPVENHDEVKGTVKRNRDEFNETRSVVSMATSMGAPSVHEMAWGLQPTKPMTIRCGQWPKEEFNEDDIVRTDQFKTGSVGETTAMKMEDDPISDDGSMPEINERVFDRESF